LIGKHFRCFVSPLGRDGKRKLFFIHFAIAFLGGKSSPIADDDPQGHTCRLSSSEAIKASRRLLEEWMYSSEWRMVKGVSVLLTPGRVT